MKTLPFGFSKSGLFIIFVGSLFCYGCNSSSNTGPHNTQPQDQTAPSPTQGTSIYRYLSAINDAYPDEESLTSLCIRQHGFKLKLPTQSIRSAHDISLPASKEWSEIQKRVTQRFRTKTVLIQPPSVNGIIMKPEEKQVEVPYSVTEYVKVNHSISGTCIGTEYILN